MDEHAPLDCRPVGTVRTPFDRRADAPRQGERGDATGVVYIDPAYAAGLHGVEPDDALDVVWYADRADRSTLVVRDGRRGVFASRSPDRPTPVCVTRCDVVAVDGARVHLRGVDMLDRSPVLDLKTALGGDRSRGRPRADALRRRRRPQR